MPPKKRPFKRPDERYYYRLIRKASQFHVGLDRREWLNLWHQHFDWEGFGDLSWRHRRRHLSVLLRALARARAELKDSRKPHQLFVIVHPRESASDAIYIHTENPHNTEFPCRLSGRKINALPSLLAGRVDLTLYEVLVSNHDEGENLCHSPARLSRNSFQVIDLE